MTRIYDSDHRHTAGPDELRLLLGGKGANLAVMTVDLGLPVPPAFTITTQSCTEYLADGWPDGLDAEIRTHLAALERRVGRRFGDPADPLLLSVRSGAPVSMPGMMDTILDLGLNDDTAEGLARVTGDAAFAADCRSRFEVSYREVVGTDPVPQHPLEQLHGAIEAVFRSWRSDRAQTYRDREGIDDDLGTAVTVQAMVFGNRDDRSATGVLFTRDPATGEAVLYGDVLFGAQGEDVVAGTHATTTLDALEARSPEVAAQLAAHADTLERFHSDACDIEFTVESGVLWLLQCRIAKRTPQAALRMAIEMAEAPDFPLTRAEAVERVRGLLGDPPRISTARDPGATPIATGLPASPGVVAGAIATTADAAVAAADAGLEVILVRAETSPGDVHGMARAVGLLTSRGGIASHAAVVARGWGIPAVVGAAAVVPADAGVAIGDRRFEVGDVITIDGRTGEIFAGHVAGGSAIAPEVGTLLDWAAELGLDIGATAPAAVVDTEMAARSDPAVSDDDLVMCLAIKGYGTADALAEALGTGPGIVANRIEDLIVAGTIESSAGAFRLTETGRAHAADRIAADSKRWGADGAIAALDAFVPLDAGVKATVTAWQVRVMEGETVVNDHADGAYDAGVIEALATLHGSVGDWFDGLGDRPARFERYRARLDRAVRATVAGDPRYIASPRVDSYHGTWFELHEDLIRLAGRRREDEVAAGRA